MTPAVLFTDAFPCFTWLDVHALGSHAHTCIGSILRLVQLSVNLQANLHSAVLEPMAFDLSEANGRRTNP